MMNKYAQVVLISLFASKLVPCLASSQATFSLVAKTPTSIIVPANRQAHVQYKVTNNTATTRTLTMVPIPNVTQLTSESSQCSNPFTLAKNQSCNLTLLVNGALQTSNYSGGPIVCKTKGNSNTPDPFLCSQPEASMALYIYPTATVIPTMHQLYVSNWDGGSISLCNINNNDGAISHCLVSAVSDTFLNPEALAINGNYLFVANIGGGISSCSIATDTGELTDCKNAIAAADPNVYGPDGIAINSNKAYISNSGPAPAQQGVTTCNVNDGALSLCNFTKGDAEFSIPSDLAYWSDEIYITNFKSNTTTYCGTEGTLCTTPTQGTINITPPSLLNEPEGLFITTINATNYAYFTNHGNHTVTLCTVTAAPTSFTNCSFTEGYFTGFGNLTILNSPLKAYIPSGLKTIAMCDVNHMDGTLSNCANSTEIGFNNPSGLVIK